MASETTQDAPDVKPAQAAEALTRETLTAIVDSNHFSRLALLYVMVKLELAEALANGPQTSDALAAASGAHPEALRRVLRAVASLGLLTEREAGTLALTDLGHLLRRGVADSIRDEVMLDWELWMPARTGLLAAVRTGESALSHVFGESLYEHLEHEPEVARPFDAEMIAISRDAAGALLAAYDFAPSSQIVDVGGGVGALLAAILLAHPHTTGIVIERPDVVAGASAYLESAGLADRCAVVGGDMFAAVPAGGDTYLLSHILHNWDDAHCAQILKNCRAALAPEGRILIFERNMPERVIGPDWAFEADVSMLVITGGRQRTEARYRALLAAADLELARVIPTAAVRSLFEARVAGTAS
ncbi:MAG TPA: methyltransferase [Ktedonobacterales bacterium]|nr:methyltransferase [Ktedonobacterales bacterium]